MTTTKHQEPPMTAETDLLPLPSGNVAHLIAAQAAEIEALRADAERYRWLRDPCSGAERVIFYCRGDYGRGLMSGAMLDAAIDEAMEKENKA